MSVVKRQGLRFIVVGVAATAVHIGVAVALVEGAHLSPFWANVPAFAIAFLVSYFGNLRWTFEVDGRHQQRIPRFLSITLFAFGLNQLIVYVVVDGLGLDYRLGLALVVLTVPPLVFFAGRYFAFADIEGAGSGRRCAE